MFLDNQDLFLDTERLLSVGPILEAPLEVVEHLTEPTHWHQSEQLLSERAVSWLPRLRGRKPAHLRATRGHLRDLVYKYWVLALIRDVNSPFLHEVISKQPQMHWNDLFGAFLHQIKDEGWFPIDWGTLDWLHEIWANEPEEIPGIIDYVTYLPLRTYGPTENDLEAGGCRYVLASFLSDEVGFDQGYIQGIAVSALDKDRLRQGVLKVDFSLFSEPLCWLADAARIAIGQTGSPILDTSTEYFDGMSFTWRKDLARIRADWQKVKPVAQRVDALVKWADEYGAAYEEEDRLQIISQLILQAGGYDVAPLY